MTNEELMQQYCAGDNSVLAELCNQNVGLIRSIAIDTAAVFGCYEREENHPEYLTGYTKMIIDELCSEGKTTFFSLLRRKDYNESQGAFSTYIYPHLRGAMYRYMEDVVGYNQNVESINDIEWDDSQDNPIAMFEDKDVIPLHVLAYRNVCADYLGELFLELSLKEKMILGQAFGVYGYRKKSLDDIALEQVMKIDGVIKARDRALERLRARLDGSKLQLFRWAYHTVMDEARRSWD